MAVSMGSSAKGVPFETFPHHIASFRVASVALCDIPTFFMDVSKVVLCGTPNTFGSLIDALQFSWQAQHLRGVVLFLFSESHCQRCAKW